MMLSLRQNIIEIDIKMMCLDFSDDNLIYDSAVLIRNQASQKWF